MERRASPSCTYGNLFRYGVSATGNTGSQQSVLTLSFVCIPDTCSDGPSNTYPQCAGGYCFDDACQCCTNMTWANLTSEQSNKLLAQEKGGSCTSKCESPPPPDCTGKIDTWEDSWGSSPQEACSQWITNDSWGALSGGSMLLEACASEFGSSKCAGTCCYTLSGKVDTWAPKWASSPEEACSAWISNSDWGALSGGNTAAESCSKFAGCAATCRATVG